MFWDIGRSLLFCYHGRVAAGRKQLLCKVEIAEARAQVRSLGTPSYAHELYLEEVNEDYYLHKDMWWESDEKCRPHALVAAVYHKLHFEEYNLTVCDDDIPWSILGVALGMRCASPTKWPALLERLKGKIENQINWDLRTCFSEAIIYTSSKSFDPAQMVEYFQFSLDKEVMIAACEKHQENVLHFLNDVLCESEPEGWWVCHKNATAILYAYMGMFIASCIKVSVTVSSLVECAIWHPRQDIRSALISFCGTLEAFKESFPRLEEERVRRLALVPILSEIYGGPKKMPLCVGMERDPQVEE